jgi:hypothetical protein
MYNLSCYTDILTDVRNVKGASPWLVFLFTLPRVQASGRVDVWRRLKRTGALPLESGGYLLPNSQDNRERFEWLAESVRQYKGTALVLAVNEIGEAGADAIRQRFMEARNPEYAAIIADAKKIRPASAGSLGEVVRLRKRLQEILAIDYFGGPMRDRAEAAVEKLTAIHVAPKSKSKSHTRNEFSNRVWQTRPRPGIDRSASAWLIVNFIDPKAKFKFAQEPINGAVRFDMYQAGGFGHRGDDCTFETLLAEFELSGKPLKVLAEMIHDADVKDEKYGRTEAIAVDKILKGWMSKGMADDELLSKGMELIDGLYRSIG